MPAVGPAATLRTVCVTLIAVALPVAAGVNVTACGARSARPIVRVLLARALLLSLLSTIAFSGSTITKMRYVPGVVPSGIVTGVVAAFVAFAPSVVTVRVTSSGISAPASVVPVPGDSRKVTLNGLGAGVALRFFTVLATDTRRPVPTTTGVAEAAVTVRSTRVTVNVFVSRSLLTTLGSSTTWPRTSARTRIL